MLAVERLSGAVDLLPVLAAEDVLEQADLFCGERIAVTGQLRSFNNRAPEGRRLIISVYAETFTTTDAPAQNEVCLEGAVCKPPVYRRTPLGREICDVMLACPAHTGARTTSPASSGAKTRRRRQTRCRARSFV